METELERNAARQYSVPLYVIGSMLAKLVPPQAYEARHIDWICI